MIDIDDGLNKMLEDTIQLAEKYCGHPYMKHLYAVMNGVTTQESMIVGVLHDIIEDTDVSMSELESILHENLIEAIQIVSRKDSETYSDFIQRIADSKNLTAIEVKLADLKNNMDLSRLNEIKQKDIDRIRKYQKAFDELFKVFCEVNENKELKFISDSNVSSTNTVAIKRKYKTV